MCSCLGAIATGQPSLSLKLPRDYIDNFCFQEVSAEVSATDPYGMAISYVSQWSRDVHAMLASEESQQ